MKTGESATVTKLTSFVKYRRPGLADKPQQRCSCIPAPSFDSHHHAAKRKSPNTFVSELCDFVDITGRTSKQLKDYLSRFWVYYNASPNLQKILENTY